MGQTGCPETSERKACSTLRKMPKERRYNLLRSGSQKLRFIYILLLSILQVVMFMPLAEISFGNILLAYFPQKLSMAKSFLKNTLLREINLSSIYLQMTFRALAYLFHFPERLDLLSCGRNI
jgi:hypothetical protein